MSAPSTAELVLRMVVSLAIMGGLLWGVLRVARTRKGGALLGVAGAGRVEHLDVVARRQLSRSASAVLVRCGSRTMLLGVADSGVQVLAEGTDLAAAAERFDRTSVEEVAAPAAAGVELAGTPAPGVVAPSPARTGVIDALRELTVRR